MSLAQNKTFQTAVLCFLCFCLGITVGVFISYEMSKDKTTVYQETKLNHTVVDYDQYKNDPYNTSRKHSMWARDTVLTFNPPIKEVAIIPVEKSDDQFAIGVTCGTGTKFFYDFRGFNVNGEWIRAIQIHHGEADISWDSVYPNKVKYWHTHNQTDSR